MSDRYLIIHGHFYQPPRENPWILALEPQNSAAPFANWNQRITRECYAPNRCSRILGANGKIKKLLNNYEHLSFNFGPTLLSWLEKADPETYARILEADHHAAIAKNGHGSALAQVYNHIIMPLANRRDRLTQIRWGMADFESRFGRRAEGMWLAETAADLETLKMMASEGLKFTILSQGQAAAVRPLEAQGDDDAWKSVAGGGIDPREPYRVVWGPGPDEHLDVFFYDGPVSRAIAFERLLSDGNSLLQRIEQAFGKPKEGGRPRLVNLATDGESYGHHFQFGDMALAWLYNHLEEHDDEDGAIQATNYGHYLSLFPPDKEVKIIDNSSWSCIHGVERWRSDCGCNTGGGRGTWNQKWRKPLRDGLDRLRDQMAGIFTSETKDLLKDSWQARDDYINVLISRYDLSVQSAFLEAHQARPLEPEEKSKIFSLLEAQLMGLYMFTSCGWFFDEISGLEPVQNLRYALRAIELSHPFSSIDLSGDLSSALSEIKPNDPAYATGLDLWRQMVLPDSIEGRALAAHWAAASTLEMPKVLNIFEVPEFESGRISRLSGPGVEIMAGKVTIHDPRLRSGTDYICLSIYSGGVHLAFLVSECRKDFEPSWMNKLEDHLGRGPTAQEALRLWEVMTDMMPDASRFHVEDLLPYCRSLLFNSMVVEIYEDLKGYAREIFHLNQHLLMMNRTSGQAVDWVERFIFRVMGETEFKRILSVSDSGLPINLASLESLLNKKGLLGLVKDESTISGLCGNFLRQSFKRLEETKVPGRLLSEMINFIKLIQNKGFNLDLWESQNLWFALSMNPNFQNNLLDEEKSLMNTLGKELDFNLVSQPSD